MRLLPYHWAFSLWHRQGKVFCLRQFALHFQQPETDKQNVVFAPGKDSEDTNGGAQVHVKKNLEDIFHQTMYFNNGPNTDYTLL